MKTAGLVLDFYDDKTGSILKTACPTPDSLPGPVKAAHVLSSEERDLLRDDAFALILHNDGQTLRKFACVDEGNTVLSTLYFMETFDRLPVEAVKVAAARLSYFNEEFGLPVPSMLKLAAETGMARRRDSFKQPVVGDEADWAQRTNLVSVRGGADSGRVNQSINTMKTAALIGMTYDPSNVVVKQLQAQHGSNWKSVLGQQRGISPDSIVEKTAGSTVKDFGDAVMRFGRRAKDKIKDELKYGRGELSVHWPHALMGAGAVGAGVRLGTPKSEKGKKKHSAVEKAAAGILSGMAAGGLAAHTLKRDWKQGAVLGGAAALGARGLGASARSGQHVADDERKFTESFAANLKKKLRKGKKKHSSVEKTAGVSKETLEAARKGLMGRGIRHVDMDQVSRNKAAYLLNRIGMKHNGAVAAKSIAYADRIKGFGQHNKWRAGMFLDRVRDPSLPPPPFNKTSSVEKTALIGPAADILGLGVPSAAGYVAGRNEGRAMAKGDVHPKNTLAGDTAKFLLMPGATGYMIGKRSGYREAKGLTGLRDHHKKKKHSSAIAVDVSHLEPEAYTVNKTASVTALNGRYSLDSYSDVQDAVRFFEENWPSLDPAERHEFSVKTASRADDLGIQVPELMERYGSTSYGPDVEAHLANRRAVAPQFKAVWDDLQEKRAMIEPEQFAGLLREADELCNLNYEWGGAVMDPFYSTFGGRGHEKLAWAWQNAEGDSLDEASLRAIPADKLSANFTPDFAEAFSHDPVTIFESMPDTSKTIIARMAGG